jgi:monoamine oxidase
VRCADGESVAAAAVVVAVPVPLLRELDLQPALPEAAAAALERTRFGDAAKLHVPLAAPPAAARVASPAALWWCWTWDAVPVVSGFAGGAEAVAATGAADGPDAWAGQALALRPELVPADGALVTHWGAEPYTRGSYSAPAVGFSPDDETALMRPWGSVVLAGEHTAGALSASMNGATASGARAASAVRDLLAQRR